MASEADPGWFFTGRVKALRRIVAWLNSAPPARGLVIYGRPGSGKSAVLARVVTLADPDQRAIATQAGALAHIDKTTVALPGSIQVAVHARAKDASQIALEIAGTLGLDLSAFGSDAELAVIGAMEDREVQSVVLVDALDEAERPDDAATFLQSLSRRAPTLRLIVGVRSESANLLSMLGADLERLDLDADAWHDPEDMVRYITAFMVSAPASSYASDHPAASQVARAVAQKAGSSFLVASLTARALSAAPTLRPDLVLEGFVLLAEPGAGKTTWLQMVARSLASKTLTGHPSGRVPILFAIRQWREGQSLEQGVFELFSSFSPCWRWTFQRLLASGQAVLLLDGYDELWNQQMPLEAEVTGLRARYPKLKCSITSRSNYPTPDPSVFGSSHQLPPPTDAEILEIQNRRTRRE